MRCLSMMWCGCCCLDTSCGGKRNGPPQRSLPVKEQVADQLNDPHISCRRRSHRHPLPPVPDVPRKIWGGQLSVQMKHKWTQVIREGWGALMALKRLTRGHCTNFASGREATLPVRDFASEQPESEVVEALSPAVRAPRQVTTKRSPFSRDRPFALLPGRPTTRQWRPSRRAGTPLETVPKLEHAQEQGMSK